MKEQNLAGRLIQKTKQAARGFENKRYRCHMKLPIVLQNQLIVVMATVIEISFGLIDRSAIHSVNDVIGEILDDQ